MQKIKSLIAFLFVFFDRIVRVHFAFGILVHLHFINKVFIRILIQTN